MYYIGVDLGTSSVKLILMEPTGDIVNTVSKTYPISFPKPGWSEQNPTDWYDKTCEGIKELIKDIDKDKVAGISFGGQMLLSGYMIGLRWAFLPSSPKK
mgnify:CR=1 FL=1